MSLKVFYTDEFVRGPRNIARYKRSMNPADLNGPRFTGISTGIGYHSIINLVARLSLPDFKIALTLHVLRCVTLVNNCLIHTGGVMAKDINYRWWWWWWWSKARIKCTVSRKRLLILAYSEWMMAGRSMIIKLSVVNSILLIFWILKNLFFFDGYNESAMENYIIARLETLVFSRNKNEKKQVFY